MSFEMYEKLKGDLIRIFMEGDNLVGDDELWLDLISKSMDSKRVLEIVRELKENGNSYYKSENFEEALERYGYAEAILAWFNFEEESDRTEFCDLALCILLNSAACFSKLKDFEQVGQVCSIVLDFQPNNVKAMYGRALAAVELGRYEWAFWDLVSAAEINPNNQEVAKLLVEVRDLIKRKKKEQSQGECPKVLGLGLSPPTKKSPAVVSKQEMDETLKDALVVDKGDKGAIMKGLNNAEGSGSLCTLEAMKREGDSMGTEDNPPSVCSKNDEDMKIEDAGKGKDLVVAEKDDGRDNLVKLSKDKENESSVMEFIGHKRPSNASEKAKEIKDVKMEDVGVNSSSSELSSTITNEDNTLSHSCSDQQLESPNLGEPIYRFYNRNRRGSSLTISQKNNHLMAQGRSLMFYNAKLGSVLEVRFVSKLDEKVCGSKDSFSQRRERLKSLENQPGLSEIKQHNADLEEGHSEVGSCVTFEDEHQKYDKDTCQAEDDCVTSCTSMPSLFTFSAKSESKPRRKHYASKAHGLHRNPDKHNKRWKLQNAEDASLFLVNLFVDAGQKLARRGSSFISILWT